MDKKISILNNIKLFFFSALLGAVTGVIIWAFLRAVGLCTNLLWDTLPGIIDFKGYAIIVCAIGGLLIGIFRKFFGDYPEELSTVMGKVKKEGHYDYSNMLVILIAAFLPLVFASSVGPEAGLTGGIVGLCYWVGDNIKYAKTHEKIYSQIGEAVTLGVLFHAPLFGIFAVEEEADEDEDKENVKLPKVAKLVLYGGAIAGGFIVFRLMSNFFGKAAEGFPSFDSINIEVSDYVAAILYVVIGVVMAYLFKYAELLAEKIASLIPAVLCETICGIVLGVVITFVPMVAFSGEDQMGEMATTYMEYTPLFLIGIALLKIVMTTICIKMGLKGGHFFPLIFACVCMGFAVAMLIFGMDINHLVFAAGTVTAACLGAQMKKPLAVTMLLLLVFPIKMIIVGFIASAIAARLGGKKESK